MILYNVYTPISPRPCIFKIKGTLSYRPIFLMYTQEEPNNRHQPKLAISHWYTYTLQWPHYVISLFEFVFRDFFCFVCYLHSRYAYWYRSKRKHKREHIVTDKISIHVDAYTSLVFTFDKNARKKQILSTKKIPAFVSTIHTLGKVKPLARPPYSLAFYPCCYELNRS